MTKHYVMFLSPGSFTAESTTKEIDSWDISKAIGMANDIHERYDATPYGFVFFTKARGDADWEPAETARSGTYFLDCEVLTVEQLEAENNPEHRILLSNMRSNGWRRIVRTTKGWQWHAPFRDGDVCVQSVIPT
jgi:hypothetical protein